MKEFDPCQGSLGLYFQNISKVDQAFYIAVKKIPQNDQFFLHSVELYRCNAETTFCYESVNMSLALVVSLKFQQCEKERFVLSINNILVPYGGLENRLIIASMFPSFIQKTFRVPGIARKPLTRHMTNAFIHRKLITQWMRWSLSESMLIRMSHVCNKIVFLIISNASQYCFH